MRKGKGRLEPRTALVIATCVLVLLICDLAARLHGFRMPPVEWFFVGLSIGIPCHELGHLIFAAIGSMPIRLIAIGVGPLLWRGRYGETWLELRILPWSGFVAPYPLVNYRWYWWALFVLGGVLGNVAVICILAKFEAVVATPDKAGDVLGAIGFAQVFIIVVNIVPRSVTVRGVRTPTDGMRLLQLLWQPRYEAAQNRVAYAARLSRYSRGNTELTISPASSRIWFDLSCYQLAADADARQDFRAALLHEVEAGDLAPEEKMWVLDALVTDGLVSRDPAVLPRLDDWSRQALALYPGLPTLLGSRGAVLVELGRYEEGKGLLAPLAAASQAGSLDSFMNRAFLALADRALGNETAARQLANAARTAAEVIEKTPLVTAMLGRLEV
jgi:Peptidase family M50